MKFWKRLLTILPIIIFLCAVFVIINLSMAMKKRQAPQIFGYSYMIVETGSMEPILKINDFIVVKAQKEYYLDNIVSFYYDINNDQQKEIVTHQIIKIEDGKYFLKGKKGDDIQEVTKEDIIGKVVFSSSFLGSLFSLQIFRNKNLIFAILTILLALFALYHIINIIKLSKKRKEESK